MTDPTAPLPARSFSAFAVEAQIHADTQAGFANQLEIMIAQRPEQPTFALTHHRAQHDAAVAAEAYELWRRMMPYEREIRELLEKLEAAKAAAAEEARTRVVKLDRVIKAARSGKPGLLDDLEASA